LMTAQLYAREGTSFCDTLRHLFSFLPPPTVSFYIKSLCIQPVSKLYANPFNFCSRPRSCFEQISRLNKNFPNKAQLLLALLVLRQREIEFLAKINML
jgi:hypothetical protein